MSSIQFDKKFADALCESIMAGVAQALDEQFGGSSAEEASQAIIERGDEIYDIKHSMSSSRASLYKRMKAQNGWFLPVLKAINAKTKAFKFHKVFRGDMPVNGYVMTLSPKGRKSAAGNTLTVVESGAGYINGFSVKVTFNGKDSEYSMSFSAGGFGGPSVDVADAPECAERLAYCVAAVLSGSDDAERDNAAIQEYNARQNGAASAEVAEEFERSRAMEFAEDELGAVKVRYVESTKIPEHVWEWGYEVNSSRYAGVLVVYCQGKRYGGGKSKVRAYIRENVDSFADGNSRDDVFAAKAFEWFDDCGYKLGTLITLTSLD